MSKDFTSASEWPDPVGEPGVEGRDGVEGVTSGPSAEVNVNIPDGAVSGNGSAPAGDVAPSETATEEGFPAELLRNPHLVPVTEGDEPRAVDPDQEFSSAEEADEFRKDLDSIAEDTAPVIVGELIKDAPQVAPEGISTQSVQINAAGDPIKSDLAPGGDYVEGGGQVVWTPDGFVKA